MLHATKLSASLTVADIQKSMVWYRDVLGFTIEQQHERDGAVRAVSMSAGDVRILLNQDDGAKGVGRVKGQGFSLQFTIAEGIDEIAASIKLNGGTWIPSRRTCRGACACSG